MQLNTLCPPDRAGCWLSRRGWPEPRPCLGSQAGLPPWSRSGQDCHDKHLCRFTLCMDWLKSRRKVNVCKSKAFFHLIKSANSVLCFTWVKIQVHRSRPVLRSPSTNSTLLSWNCTFSHCFQEPVKFLFFHLNSLPDLLLPSLLLLCRPAKQLGQEERNPTAAKTALRILPASKSLFSK